MITSCFEECGNEDWPKIHSTWQVKESDLMTSYDFFTCFVLHPAVRRLPRSLDISVANYESEANWKLGSWKARKWAILQFDLSYIRIYFWHHIRGNIRARTETTTDVLWLAKYKLVTKGHHAGKGNAWGTRCDTSSFWASQERTVVQVFQVLDVELQRKNEKTRARTIQCLSEHLWVENLFLLAPRSRKICFPSSLKTLSPDNSFSCHPFALSPLFSWYLILLTTPSLDISSSWL